LNGQHLDLATPDALVGKFDAVPAISLERGAQPDKRPTLCFPLAGDSLGGSHHSLRGLLQLLDQKKYRILVVVEVPGGKLSEFFNAFEQCADPAAPRKSFTADKRMGPLKFATTLTGLLKRRRFLREHHVRIVHTNDGRSHATWALAAKAAGARLLWHHRADPQARGLRFLAPWVADQIVTVSRFSLPQGNTSRAVRDAKVIFSPFDTDIVVDRVAQRAKLCRELMLPDDAFIVGFFGNLIDRKRPVMFVDAISQLQTMIENPVYGLVFGEAEDKAMEREIEQRTLELGLRHQIRLMGYRSPGSDWIAACDVLSVPAVGEPLGRTLIEAMVVGTPVVATRSGGNPEAILDGLGILVEPDDPTDMARGCAKIARGFEGEAAMIAEAKVSAASRFTRTRHLRSVEQVYERLLAL
jgi:glycosyltransferase involved in cell wall biosynthesis